MNEVTFFFCSLSQALSSGCWRYEQPGEPPLAIARSHHVSVHHLRMRILFGCAYRNPLILETDPSIFCIDQSISFSIDQVTFLKRMAHHMNVRQRTQAVKHAGAQLGSIILLGMRTRMWCLAPAGQLRR